MFEITERGKLRKASEGEKEWLEGTLTHWKDAFTMQTVEQSAIIESTLLMEIQAKLRELKKEIGRIE